MGASRDAVGLAAGQGPAFAVGPALGRGFQRGDLIAPGQVVLGFGQHVAVAQAVEHGLHHRPARQEVDRQPGQVEEGRVEHHQPPVPVEDGEPRRELGKGLGQRLDKGGPRLLGGDDGVGVGGEMDLAGVAGQRRDLEPLRAVAARQADLLARGDGLAVGRCRDRREQRILGPGRAMAGRQAKRMVRQVEIGAVGPDQRALRVGLPDQMGQILDQGAQGAQFVGQRVVLDRPARRPRPARRQSDPHDAVPGVELQDFAAAAVGQFGLAVAAKFGQPRGQFGEAMRQETHKPAKVRPPLADRRQKPPAARCRIGQKPVLEQERGFPRVVALPGGEAGPQAKETVDHKDHDRRKSDCAQDRRKGDRDKIQKVHATNPSLKSASDGRNWLTVG